MDSLDIIYQLNERDFSLVTEEDDDSDFVFVQNTHCKYFNEDQFHKSICTISKKQFSLVHFNARSLYKNFDSICAYLMSLNYPFSLIGITETWMNDKPDIFSLPAWLYILSIGSFIWKRWRSGVFYK